MVSIVTVCLNAALTIEDTIRSVAMQAASFQVEHVIVDGGSRDSTREIIDRWVERCANIKKIYESDEGIFDAMNKGFRSAAGTYVLFLNSDDFLVTPDVLARAMRCVTPDGKNPDLILGDVSMATLGQWGIWRHRRVPRLLGRLRGIGLFPVHQGLFIKRELLSKSGGYPARMRLAADVVHFYDVERKLQPSVVLLKSDVTFMRAGGAANAGIRAMCIGSLEIFHHLVKTHNAISAAAMVCVKTFQSLSELRLGRCPHSRWFASDELSA